MRLKFECCNQNEFNIVIDSMILNLTVNDFYDGTYIANGNGICIVFECNIKCNVCNKLYLAALPEKYFPYDEYYKVKNITRIYK